MKITGKFVLNRYGVRHQILLDQHHANITEALVSRAQNVKPPGTEVFVSESRGRSGRKVIWIMDRTPYDAFTRKGRNMQRAWKKRQLQEALVRIGGRFLRRRGKNFS